MLLPIVDSTDRIVAFKSRDAVDPATDIIRAASLILLNSTGEILLARRSVNKKSEPGRWGETVGGTVEGRDSYLETLKREVQEELGLDLPPGYIGPRIYSQGTPPYFTQWFVARADIDVGSLTLQVEEVDAVEWFSLDRLKRDYRQHPEWFIESMKAVIEIADSFAMDPDMNAYSLAA